MDFATYAALPDAELDLLTGALLIAKDAYPALDSGAQSERLTELAAPLRERALHRRPILAQAMALGEYLHATCGFRGNEHDYYDPRNSFLNDVLERRLGIPISLAVVYIELGRRLGVRARGVGFPGHFLVRLDDPERAEGVIVDPFRGFRVLDRADLEALLQRAQGGKPIALDAGMLAPAPTRQILARMLMNLRGIYAMRADYPRLLVVLDRLISLLPDVANELRDRGLLWAKLGAPQAAIDDLKRYLDCLPHAGDSAEVRRLIHQLERANPDLAN